MKELFMQMQEQMDEIPGTPDSDLPSVSPKIFIAKVINYDTGIETIVGAFTNEAVASVKARRFIEVRNMDCADIMVKALSYDEYNQNGAC